MATFFSTSFKLQYFITLYNVGLVIQAEDHVIRYPALCYSLSVPTSIIEMQ